MNRWTLGISILIVATSAVAQEAASTAARDDAADPAVLAEAPLTIDIDAGVWLVRLSGNSSNLGETIDFRDGFRSAGVGSLEAGFRGDLTVRKGEWGGRVMGTHASWSGDATVGANTTWGTSTLVPNVNYPSSFKMTWLGVEALWEPWTIRGDGRRDTLDPLEVFLGPNVGVNWINIDQSIDGVGTNGSWWTAYGGGQLELVIDLRPVANWLHSLTVDVGGSIGSTVSDGGLFFKVRGGCTVNCTPNIGVSIGYRLMEYDGLSSGNWTVDPEFPGLYIGVNVEF